MRHILAKHHHAMTKLYREKAETLDDDHEAKGFLHQLAKHHHDLAKALDPSSATEGDMPEVGRETRTGDAGYGIRPVPEIKKRQEDIDAELERMFGDI